MLPEIFHHSKKFCTIHLKISYSKFFLFWMTMRDIVISLFWIAYNYEPCLQVLAASPPPQHQKTSQCMPVAQVWWIFPIWDYPIIWYIVVHYHLLIVISFQHSWTHHMSELTLLIKPVPSLLISYNAMVSVLWSLVQSLGRKRRMGNLILLPLLSNNP